MCLCIYAYFAVNGHFASTMGLQSHQAQAELSVESGLKYQWRKQQLIDSKNYNCPMTFTFFCQNIKNSLIYKFVGK